jgi:hypothetical protein
MRSDLVLNLAQPGDGQPFIPIPYLTPKAMRSLGRSIWRTTKHVRIQGGPFAINGWGAFQETFVIDDIESARYVSWYYNLLARAYLNNITAGQLYEMMTVDMVSDFVRTFYFATKQPRHPAMVLVHQDLGAILGAHLRFDNDKVHWGLDKRYVGLMSRIANLGMLFLVASPEPFFMMGWLWREPGKPWRRKRAWFTHSYDPTSDLLQTTPFHAPGSVGASHIPTLYDTNIYVPGHVRHVKERRIPEGGWSAPKSRLALRSGPKDTSAPTWFG